TAPPWCLQNGLPFEDAQPEWGQERRCRVGLKTVSLFISDNPIWHQLQIENRKTNVRFLHQANSLSHVQRTSGIRPTCQMLPVQLYRNCIGFGLIATVHSAHAA
ncbi:hypothetical protein, partial [Yoonia sp.]|uniref:hypothetical protein n=1 Tax=Yoonia sp. TaxID=2212373 RepID=UPI002E190DBF